MAVETVQCSRCGSGFARRQVEGDFAGICPRCLAGFVMSPPAEDTVPPRMETLASPLRPGDRLEGFEIDGVLGQGGMGVVYRARQASLNRTVALKILSPHLAGSAEFAKRFEREARILAALNHPNVVQVYDFGRGSDARSGDFLYLAMEYVDGTTLEDVVRQGPVDVPRLLKVVRDVVRGLERVHGAGLVHRDIKPSNILIAKDGTAKISDFGLAIETEDVQRLTQSGMLVGTPQYLSPEHAQGKKVDGRSDLYALGVILFEGAAGRLPFQAPSAPALLLKHVNEPPPPLYKFAPQAPRALQEIVRKLLAKNPASRYENAAALGRDLDRAMGAAPVPPAPTARVLSPAPAAGTGKGIPWKWVGVGAGALALVTALVALLPGGSKPPPEKPAPVVQAKVPAPGPVPPRTEPPVVKVPVEAKVPPVPKPAEPAPATPVRRAAPQDPPPDEPAPAPVEPKAADPFDEVWRQAETLFGEARTLYEDGRTRSSAETLSQAGFKAEEAQAKYRALQEVGNAELRKRASDQVKAVQQFMKLVNESRLAVANAGAPAPKPPAPDPVPHPPAPAPAPPPAPVVKGPVPGAADLKAAEKEIRDLFRAEYARKAPAEVAAFARKLLEQGVVVRDDPKTAYVLLRESRDLALQSGDWGLALEAVAAMGRAFEMDVLASRQAVLARAAAGVRGAEPTSALAEAHEALAREAVAADDYEVASACAAKGEMLARAAQDAAAVARLDDLKKETAFLKEEYAKVKAFLAKPEAREAEAAGRFLCLCKGDWGRGLPVLASAPSPLGELAAKDLAAPREAEKQAEVADGWWDQAEKEKQPIRKGRLQERARLWYEAAVSGSSGLARARIEKRLGTLEGAQKGPVDLIALVRPERDSVAGRWQVEQGRLTTEPEWFGRVMIPYVPPDEYDWRLVVERKKGADDFFIGLIRGDTGVGISIDAGRSTFSGIGVMTRRGDTVGRLPGGLLGIDRQAVVLLQVRKKTFTLTVDGKKVVSYTWKGNEARELMAEKWDVPNREVLFVGAHGSAFLIHQMTVTPVSGQGRVFRPAAGR